MHRPEAEVQKMYSRSDEEICVAGEEYIKAGSERPREVQLAQDALGRALGPG